MKVYFREMEVEMQVVTEDRLEDVAEWVDGAVYGLKLPPRDREVRFRGVGRREYVAEVGEVIVKFITVDQGVVTKVFTEEEALSIFTDKRR
jgi:hypothetical protein